MNQACPTGFVIPDHPDNFGVEYVNRTITDCAFSCVNHPRYLPSEYNVMFGIRLGSIIFNAIMSFMAVNIWLMDRQNYRTNFFVIVYGCAMFLGSFVLACIFSAPPSKRLCQDNATPIYVHPQSTCTTEGFFQFYTLLVMCVCWALQSFELFKTIILGRKKGPVSKYLYWIFGLPLVCAGTLAVAGSFVFQLGKINCDLWAKNPELEFMLAWVPTMIAVFFGIVFTVSIAVKILFLYNAKANRGNSNFWDILKIFSTALKYMFAFGFYLGSIMLVALASGNGDSSASDIELDRAWGMCVFEHYDGVSDASFRSVCGDTPKRLVSFSTLCFFQFYMLGMNGVFFVGVHWDSLQKLYYRACWPRWYHAKVNPYDVGQLPVSVSSAMPEDVFAGLKPKQDGSSNSAEDKTLKPGQTTPFPHSPGAGGSSSSFTSVSGQERELFPTVAQSNIGFVGTAGTGIGSIAVSGVGSSSVSDPPAVAQEQEPEQGPAILMAMERGEGGLEMTKVGDHEQSEL